MTVPELSVTEERIVLLSANGASNARIAAGITHWADGNG